MKKVFIAAALAAMIVSCGSIAMKVFCQLPMPKVSTIN